jgi:hypothetical protein
LLKEIKENYNELKKCEAEEIQLLIIQSLKEKCKQA